MTDSPRPDPSDRIPGIVAVLLAVMAVFGLWDLLTDAPRVWRGAHALIEIGFILLAGTSALLLALRWRDAERSLAGVRRSLEERRAERDAWQRLARKALEGLGVAMDQQFAAWGLTAAEKETALLLLKGYSHKEVGNLTSRSERTVRQHAVSVYRKSGLSGRAELAAFFFEDMLLPAQPPTGAPGGEGGPRV